MSTLNIQSLCRKSKKISQNYRYLLPELVPWLQCTLSGSNYPCLERISMVPKMFEPLRFDCTCLQTAKTLETTLIHRLAWVLLIAYVVRALFSCAGSKAATIKSTKVIIITDLLIIDHLISVYLPLVFWHLNPLPYFNLKFEQVQFTTHCCV